MKYQYLSFLFATLVSINVFANDGIYIGNDGKVQLVENAKWNTFSRKMGRDIDIKEYTYKKYKRGFIRRRIIKTIHNRGKITTLIDIVSESKKNKGMFVPAYSYFKGTVKHTAFQDGIRIAQTNCDVLDDYKCYTITAELCHDFINAIQAERRKAGKPAAKNINEIIAGINTSEVSQTISHETFNKIKQSEREARIAILILDRATPLSLGRFKAFSYSNEGRETINKNHKEKVVKLKKNYLKHCMDADFVHHMQKSYQFRGRGQDKEAKVKALKQ